MAPADRFDSPVGTQAERDSLEVPPGDWYSSNNFGNYYLLKRGDTPDKNVYSFHTGADLLLWPGGGAHQPIYAVANGRVTFAERVPASTWGNLIVIVHELADGSQVYSRYGHVENMAVKAGDLVERGQQIAQEGNAFGQFPYHLHFDISPTERLATVPTDWPGLDSARVKRDYVDPLTFIRENREVKLLATLEQLRAVRAQALGVRDQAQAVITSLDNLIGTETPAPQPVAMYALVEGLRIRQATNTSSTILKELAYGEAVTVTAINGDWATVSAPVAGYVWKASLSLTRPR